MYSLSKTRDEILKYRLKEVLNSGELSMFDEKIDREKLERYLNGSQNENLEVEKPEKTVDLKSTLEHIDENKLYESIINLKYRHVEWSF